MHGLLWIDKTRIIACVFAVLLKSPCSKQKWSLVLNEMRCSFSNEESAQINSPS